MCKYCEGGVPVVSGTNLGFAILNQRCGKAYLRGYDKNGWDVSENFIINYCPMCGEKLNKDNTDIR